MQQRFRATVRRQQPGTSWDFGTQLEQTLPQALENVALRRRQRGVFTKQGFEDAHAVRDSRAQEMLTQADTELATFAEEGALGAACVQLRQNLHGGRDVHGIAGTLVQRARSEVFVHVPDAVRSGGGGGAQEG